MLEKIGWTPTDGEDEQIPLLRSSLVSALGGIAEDGSVIAEARRLFALDVADEPGLAPDLAASVLAVVSAHATREEFDAIVERYRHPRTPMEEIRNLTALANVRDPALAEEVRELCRTEVRSQNAPYILGAMVRNRFVGAATFRYIVDHFDELAGRFPDNSIHRMLEGVSGLVADEAGSPTDFDAVAEFLRAHVPGARGRLIEQSLERLEVNLRFAVAVQDELGTRSRADGGPGAPAVARDRLGSGHSLDHPVTTPARLLAAARTNPGFLADAEGACLYEAERAAALGDSGPLVEIGSYLGRSTLFLAAGIAASGTGRLLFSVDHHHGSEEMQSGWAHHDPDLVDPETGVMDSLPAVAERDRERAGADRFVVGVVGDSTAIARAWGTPLALCFIDGGHAPEVTWADYRGWAPHIAPGGLLAFHDVFADPADGGRPPYECYRDAITSGAFTEDGAAATGSLRVLVRTGSNTIPVARPPESRSAARTTAAAE